MKFKFENESERSGNPVIVTRYYNSLTHMHSRDSCWKWYYELMRSQFKEKSGHYYNQKHDKSYFGIVIPIKEENRFATKIVIAFAKEKKCNLVIL